MQAVYLPVRINFNMGCIETKGRFSVCNGGYWINFNMGCIETLQFCQWKTSKKRLTLTWDVLKRNGRPFYMPGLHRLTLTWDVLKHVLVGVDYLAELRLTLTWDVLKLVRQFICVSAKEINFNMRCIKSHERPKHKE